MRRFCIGLTVLAFVGIARLAHAEIDPNFTANTLAPTLALPQHDAAESASWLGEHAGYQVESGAASTYVFRGRLQYVNRGDASSQSTAAATIKGAGPGDFTFTAWNATALTRHAQAGNASEVDLTPSYTASAGEHVSLTGGYIAYLYPQHLPSQHLDGEHEIFAGISLPNAFLTPSVSVYAELVRLHGAYATAGFSRTFTVDSFTFTPQASVGVEGYSDTPFRMNDVSAMFTSQWNFHPPFYANARLAYSYMGGETAQLPGGDGSFGGRSVPWTMLALGMSH